MKKKQNKRDEKTIKKYQKDVDDLMGKYDFLGFLAGLRMAKIAFVMSCRSNDKKFMKGFIKMSGEDTVKFVDKMIAPTFSWIHG